MSAVPERPLNHATVTDCHRLYGPMLERYAWAIVRDWSLAADAVQNGFVALARFGGDVLPEARKNWLFRVVHREALRIRDKQSRFQNKSNDVGVVQEPSAEYLLPPLEQVLLNEQIQQLEQGVSRLPVEQRQVVQMRIYENKTFSEIAHELGIPLGTALSRMRLALERLRLSVENSD